MMYTRFITKTVPVIVALFFVLVLTAVSGPLYGEARTVRVGASDFMPLIRSSSSGAEGLFVDIFEAVARDEGWTTEYVHGTWNDLMGMLQGGTIDILPGMVWSEARDGLFDFTKNPVLVDSGTVFVRKDHRISSMFDVGTGQIACVSGSIFNQTFREYCSRLGYVPRLKEFGSFGEVFDAVSSGAVAAGICSSVGGDYLLRSHESLERTYIHFGPRDMGFAVRKGSNGDLIAAIDRLLPLWKQNPDSPFHKAWHAWAVMPVSFSVPYWIFIILGILFVTVLVVALFMVLLRKQVAAKTLELEDTLKDLSAAQAYAHMGNWTWDIPTGRLSWSAEMYRLFGVDPGTEEVFLPSIIKTRIHPEDLPAVEASNNSVSQQGEPVPLEYRIVHPDGMERTVWAKAGKLEKDRSGKPLRLSGYVLDITEEKQKSLLKAKARDERERILKELYHRTKNNMFQITALMILMSEESSDRELKTFVDDMVLRIQSMSLVHQFLYKSPDFARVDIAGNLPLLVHKIVNGSLGGRNVVNFKTTVVPVILSLDDAITWCLGLSEVIMQTCKYYSRNRQPAARDLPLVQLEVSEDQGWVQCRVSGPPVESSQKSDSGFNPASLKLLDILFRQQLFGSVDCPVYPQPDIQIRIPLERKPPQWK